MQAEVFEAFRSIAVAEDEAPRRAASRARALGSEIGSAPAPCLVASVTVQVDDAAFRVDACNL